MNNMDWGLMVDTLSLVILGAVLGGLLAASIEKMLLDQEEIEENLEGREQV